MSDGLINDQPTLGEVYRLTQDILGEQRALRRDLFVGRESVSGRLSAVEGVAAATRDDVNGLRDDVAVLRAAGPRAAWFGGIGTSLGAAIVVVLGYLGIRPPGQQ